MIPLTWHDIINIPTLSNSGYICLVDCEVRYMVCTRGFPYLDYHLSPRRTNLMELEIEFIQLILPPRTFYIWHIVHTCIHKSVLTIPSAFTVHCMLALRAHDPLIFFVHVYLLLRTPLSILMYSLGCIMTTQNLHVQIPELGVSGSPVVDRSA